MRIPILYEDNHLLIVEKPVNIPVQGDNTGDKDLLTILKEDLKIRYQKPGNVYLGLVHRLDRPVGGVIVFAKTSKAASRMSDVIRRQAMERRYFTVVRGSPTRSRAILMHHLMKDKHKNKVYAVSPNHKEAKKASLEYVKVAEEENHSLLSIELHTGRSHQIRVQLSTEGTPIYGDQKYGQDINRPGQQIALWAYSLCFEHPVKKEMIEVKCPPPNKYPWELFSGVLDLNYQSSTKQVLFRQ
ncbi:RluA family pseudouridine synthase [Oceanobacillus chungangensis]|uniref:RNA pseudouridylate synthase n=1 Tax=Oceanobacillus chungangensis TaxID=1229152 RepID=A0A3D8PJJ2_9BACI|nr:RluA family pseudouridine synthase [Oceanobacillus chungangensis]RDW16214.1 RNA pseudouridine synthase [Oceanobacillus chungangensis]